LLPADVLPGARLLGQSFTGVVAIMQDETIASLNPWEQILRFLEEQVDAKNLVDWLRPAACQGVEGTSLRVCAPNATIRDLIEANYGELIHRAVRELKLPLHSVVFVLPDQAERTQAAVAGAGQSAPAALPIPPSTPSFFADSLSAPLNSKYTFASFVVGGSNQFAHAAASRAAADPGRSYNPLFLYGGAGLGKTHLLQAIAQALRARYPQWRVVYLSAERFTNEMVHSIKNDSMVTFQRHFRNVDTLLVDDIQFLSRKERTQEEFFHTFNTLYERQIQIVLSSDRPPKDIDEVEVRLRSRFECGLIADIQPPDLETRQAILMKKAEAENFPLPEKTALFVASKVKSNIRELEGCLIRLMAYTSLTGEAITEGMAREVLTDLVSSGVKKTTIESVQKVVCEHFGLRLYELRAKDNSKRVVFPRQIAMWVAREVIHASLPEIARAFGDKHHTTVLHSINKISSRRLADKDLNRTLNKLLNAFE
jgi:chromosomal replication initiator protein